MPDSSSINSMFGRIAHRYDFANLLLSGGCCTLWTRRLVREVARVLPPEGGIVADLATGSGDVVFALARRVRQTRIRGLDFCEPMLDKARERLAALEKACACAPPALDSARISFERGDCMALPLEDASTDVVTIAYGVRNFQDRVRGLREIHRVLRKGGSAFVLEFSQPSAWVRPAYYFYLRHLLPWLARAATGNRDAYEYLGGSILAFPTRAAFSQNLLDAGFADVRAIPLTFGIVAIHHARK